MRARQDMVDRRGFVCKAATLAGATAFMPSVAARATAPGGPSTIQLAQTQLAQSVAASATPLTIKSVERLVGSTTNYAYAVKAGPWIFLNGHEAYDFEKGLAPEVEGPRGYALSGRPPLRREADYILARMRGILKDFGSDLPNAVRVDQYYTMGRLCRPTTSRNSQNSKGTFRQVPRSSWNDASARAPIRIPR